MQSTNKKMTNNTMTLINKLDPTTIHSLNYHNHFKCNVSLLHITGHALKYH